MGRSFPTSVIASLPLRGEPKEVVVVVNGGTATFTLTVPRGRDTIQAFAEFTVP